MVCIEIEEKTGITTTVKITGDFFLHPEEAIEKVEKSLTGIPITTNEKELIKKIKNALGSAQLIGVSSEDLARLFMKAVS